MATQSFLVLCIALAAAHSSHNDQKLVAGPHQGLWYNGLPGDGGTQV